MHTLCGISWHSLHIFSTSNMYMPCYKTSFQTEQKFLERWFALISLVKTWLYIILFQMTRPKVISGRQRNRVTNKMVKTVEGGTICPLQWVSHWIRNRWSGIRTKWQVIKALKAFLKNIDAWANIYSSSLKIYMWHVEFENEEESDRKTVKNRNWTVV